jgi:AraC-like DNA-binding protein
VTIAAGSNRKPRALSVLGALLGESPEAALLQEAIRPPTLFRSVEDRFRVLAAVREHAPDVVVFAVQDRQRLPTAPLIGQCVRERPGSRIVLLCLAPPPRGGALLAAARAGARVLVAPTSHELESILARVTRSLATEVALDCDTLTAVQPPALRELLCAAARTVADDGRVSTLARHLRVSTRTLSRHTRHTSFVSPRTVLSATRLLWACALMESARRDVGAVARTAGFAGPNAIFAATRRYLGPHHVDAAATSLPDYRDALRYIVDALGGHLST